MSSPSTVTVSEPKVEISLNNILVSKKNKEGGGHQGSMPSNFVVSAKIDEELRRDGHLLMSFSMTLNDPVNLATFEFRGSCMVGGTSRDFEYLMKTREGSGESKIPKILDILYQRLYSLVFILAGMTTSTYPQSTALTEDAVRATEQVPNFGMNGPSAVQTEPEQIESSTITSSENNSTPPSNGTISKGTSKRKRSATSHVNASTNTSESSGASTSENQSPIAPVSSSPIGSTPRASAI